MYDFDVVTGPSPVVPLQKQAASAPVEETLTPARAATEAQPAAAPKRGTS